MPIRVSSAIEIGATSQLVWEVFTDIHRWSDWNPLIIEVTSISGGTIWAPGGAFVMRYKTDFTPIQATARSFVQQVLPGRRIVLSGDVLGSRGTITYDFTSYGAKTVVSATEVFAETDSDYRNYVISSTTQRLLTVLLRGLKNQIENMGHKARGAHA
ncbi:MAG: SRPBCC family protein [Halobacteriota archaeon]